MNSLDLNPQIFGGLARSRTVGFECALDGRDDDVIAGSALWDPRDRSNPNDCLPRLRFEMRLTAFALKSYPAYIVRPFFVTLLRAMWALDLMLRGPALQRGSF